MDMMDMIGLIIANNIFANLLMSPISTQWHMKPLKEK